MGRGRSCSPPRVPPPGPGGAAEASMSPVRAQAWQSTPERKKKRGKHPYPARLGYFLSTICCNSVQRLHFPGAVPYPTPFVLLIAVNPIQNTVRLGPPNRRLCRGFWSLHLLLVYMYAGIYVKPLFKVIQGLALSLQRPMSGQ